MTSNRQDISTQRFSVVAAWLGVALITLLVSQPAGADQYRAFYYNSKGKLLQVEDVPDGELASRTLVDVNTYAGTIPMLTGAVYPPTSGNNKKMHRSAKIAVYYTFSQATPPEDGDQDVQAIPVKVEDVSEIDDRTLAICLARDGSQPCIFPRRCHCMTGSCCCY